MLYANSNDLWIPCGVHDGQGMWFWLNFSVVFRYGVASDVLWQIIVVPRGTGKITLVLIVALALTF